MKNGIPRYAEVLFGEEICRRLKDLYAANQPWSPALSDQIGAQFAFLMRKCLPFFPQTSLLDALRQVSQSTNFKELCEDSELLPITGEVLRGTGNQSKLAAQGQKIQAKIFWST